MRIGDYFFYHVTYPEEWLVGKVIGKAALDIGGGYRFRIVAAHIPDYRPFNLEEKDEIGQVQIGSFMWERMKKIDDKREVIKEII